MPRPQGAERSLSPPPSAQRPRPHSLGRAFLAPPPAPRAGFGGFHCLPRPPGVPPPRPGNRWGRARLAGRRRPTRCPHPVRAPLSEEPFTWKRGDARESGPEGPLREPAASRARHGAGGGRRLGPQPRRAQPAGDAAALLALVKTIARGCRGGHAGRGAPGLGGGDPLPPPDPPSGPLPPLAELVPALPGPIHSSGWLSGIFFPQETRLRW